MTTECVKNQEGALPDDIRLVSAAEVRRGWGVSEATLWRAERDGRLHALRIGRKKYYRLSDLRAFLDAASHAPPISVPWKTPSDEFDLTSQPKGE